MEYGKQEQPQSTSAGEAPDASRPVRLFGGRSRQEMILLLLYCYVFLLTLGILQRPFGNPFGFGISSIISVTLVALSLREILQMIKAHLMLQLWFLLLVYVLAVTLINSPARSFLDPQYKHIFSLVQNLMLCAAVSSLNWNTICLRRVGIFLILGLSISGLLVVIDDIEIMNLAPINTSLINDPPIREPVAQFGHRSIMSLYLAVMLTYLFVLEDRNPSRWLSTAVLTVGICFLYFLIYSRNRSGIGAIFISMTTYYAFNLRRCCRWLHPRFPLYFLAFVFAFVLTFLFRQWQFENFISLLTNSPLFSDFLPSTRHKLNDVQVGLLRESDMLRVDIIRSTFSTLNSTIFGNGFMANTHVHFLVDIVHAAGYFGVLWIAASTYLIASMIRLIFRSGMEQHDSLWLILIPLISWFFVGLMYNALHLGLGWVYFGMLLALHGKMR